MIIPLKMAGRYIRSHIVIGFLETGFILLVKASIVYKKFIPIVLYNTPAGQKYCYV